MTRIAKPALTLSLLTSVLLASTAPATAGGGAGAGKANMDGLAMVKHVDVSTTVQPRAGSQTIGQN